MASVLRTIDAYEGTLTVQCALRLAPLVFVRPGELRTAEWKDIDLDQAEWRYTVTKTNTLHIVPLCRQAVEILKELHPLTGQGRYVFPGARSTSRPMSDNAVLAAMRRMGIAKGEMSGTVSGRWPERSSTKCSGFDPTSSNISCARGP